MVNAAGYAPLMSAEDDGAEESEKSALPYGGYNEASRLRRWTYEWVTPIVKRGSQQQLCVDDVPPIPAMMRVTPLVELMKRKCAEAGVFAPEDEKKTLLRNVMVPLFRREYFAAWCFNVVQQSCELSMPILLRKFIQWHGRRDEPFWIGAVLSMLLFTFTITVSICMANGGVRNYVSGLKMRASMMALIFEKSTKMAGTGAQTTGQIVNYMSSDSQRFPESCMMTNHMIMTPIWLSLAMAQLVYLMGASGLLGTAIMVLGLASNKRLWKILKRVRTEQMRNTDGRIMLVNEALAGIRVLKQCDPTTALQSALRFV